MGPRRNSDSAKKLAPDAAAESQGESMEATLAQPAGKRQRVDGPAPSWPIAGSNDEVKAEGALSDGDSNEGNAGGQDPPLKSEKGVHMKCDCCGCWSLCLAWPRF